MQVIGVNRQNACHLFWRYSYITGLSLLLFTEIDQYVAELAGSIGFKVVVHDHNQVPFPEEQGFHVAAGFKTLNRPQTGEY